MEKIKKRTLVFAILFTAWALVRIVYGIQFSIECEQYLKRAADANTVETAKEELSRAISYIERNNLTEGVVSIFFEQPNNDIGYWYKNLKEAYAELDKVTDDASSIEKTNLLMKLRETLTDQKESGVKVTVPEGISIYPNNVVFFWWGTISGVLLTWYCIKMFIISLT